MATRRDSAPAAALGEPIIAWSPGPITTRPRHSRRRGAACTRRAVSLASGLATYVTGGIYTVDGGATASGGLPGLQAKSEAKTAPEGTVRLEHQQEGRGTLGSD